jgi:hypothetical protein
MNDFSDRLRDHLTTVHLWESAFVANESVVSLIDQHDEAHLNEWTYPDSNLYRLPVTHDRYDPDHRCYLCGATTGPLRWSETAGVWECLAHSPKLGAGRRAVRDGGHDCPWRGQLGACSDPLCRWCNFG